MCAMKVPLGVKILGVFLIVTSVYQIQFSIPYWPSYKAIHQDWPRDFILVRYIGSYCWRFIGLALGVGVLFLKERYRKILYWFCILLIASGPLRHTYSTVHACAVHAWTGASEPFLAHYAMGVMWACRLIDTLFALIFLWYFTRQKTIQHFSEEGI
jgi:hypothetical protein